MDKQLSCSEKLGAPRNTLSTCTKNKNELLQNLEKPCQMQSNGTMIKEKVPFFVEKIDFPNFKASDHWMCKW